MIAFTIVNANYLHFAFTLAESYLENNVDSEFYIFLLGSEREVVGNLQGLKVINLNDSFVNDLNQRAFYYEITELSTSVKPDCFLYLFNLGYKKVIYLDPDIYVTESLQPLSNILEENSIVITPHSTTPIYDQRLPDDLNFLKAGAYNLGFIAVSNGSVGRKFIQWWSDRLSVNAFNSFSKGMFTDQKWADLVPSYFDGVYILKNPGYNVAYWNLHERRIDRVFGNYTSNDEKLRFFHFSGISLKDDKVSKYTTRYDSHFDLGLDAVALFVEYRRKLATSFQNTEKQRALPYMYNQFIDGALIGDMDRLLYFNSFIRGVTAKNPFLMTRDQLMNLIAYGKQSAEISEFTTDPRIEQAAEKLGNLPPMLKRLARVPASGKLAGKVISLVNNSINKVNISRMIYALYRSRE